MSKKRKLIISVGTIEEAAKEFVDIWHHVEVDSPPKNAPIEKISFSNERLLFKTLTTKRRDLLRCLHEHGRVSIRALAKELNRDYSNVYQDVKALTHIGLILKDEKTDRYYMPWDLIVTEIPMTTPRQDSHYAGTHRHAKHR